MTEPAALTPDYPGKGQKSFERANRKARAMEREHIGSKDSVEPFTVGNYGTVTTSHVEWYFTVDPSGGLARLAAKAAGWVPEAWPGTEGPHNTTGPPPEHQPTGTQPS